MMYRTYIVAGVCLLLLLVLLYFEYTRANKKFLLWRIVATTIAVLSLAAMALPIHITQQQKRAAQQQAILLTRGYSVDTVEALLSKTGAGTPVFYLDEFQKPPSALQANFLFNPSALTTSKNQFGLVHVVGEGLAEEELAGMKDLPVVFHPTVTAIGITVIKWTTHPAAGEPLIVQGNFNNQRTTALKLVLQAFNTHLDSVTLAAKSQTTFQFRTLPKQTGTALYTLTALAGNDTVIHEPVPVNVGVKKAAQILLLASSPDFENKFLKNQLAAHGYGVAVRSAISKNRYAKEYTNLAAFPLEQITSTVLDKFDVVITDADAYAALGKQEQASLQNNVSSKGLGLIVKAGSEQPPGLFFSRTFPVSQSPDTAGRVVQLYLADTTIHLPPLNTAQQAHIRPRAGTQPLVYNRQSQVLAGLMLFGSGKIIVSTLGDTYQWVLEGKQQAYQQLWSLLINKVARPEALQEQWTTLPAVPRIHEEMNVQVQTIIPGLPRGQVGDQFIYLQQHSRFANTWSGKLWPFTPGWNVALKTDGTPWWWYAYAAEDYRMVRAAERTNATRHYALLHPPQPASVFASFPVKKDFPKWVFFVLLLSACGFLWVERKFL